MTAILSQKLKNIDPILLFCFITANKEYIDHLKRNIPDLEEIVIYMLILLSELRNKIHLLLVKQERKAHELSMVLWLRNNRIQMEI
jgi:hypothetical protein